jgi:hypothetical protein
MQGVAALAALPTGSVLLLNGMELRCLHLQADLGAGWRLVARLTLGAFPPWEGKKGVMGSGWQAVIHRRCLWRSSALDHFLFARYENIFVVL